jgi:CheY-like chemotaxis protein
LRTWTEGDRVCVEVRDTGKGIAPEHMKRIFEPFFTTQEVGAGSGLGLPICKNIIGSLGGEIDFESEIGKGTRFLIRLPCMPSGWGAAHVVPEEKALETPAMRGRILVVDDEAGIRAILVRILGGDHEVITASDGIEARELLETDRSFDLILCDLMMPKMSGMVLHKWLTVRDPALSEQVVFITGGAFTPGASQYLAEVKNLRFEKPFDDVNLKRLAIEFVLAARTKRKG